MGYLSFILILYHKANGIMGVYYVCFLRLFNNDI